MQAAVARLGTDGAFLTNLQAKIPLPKNLMVAERTARQLAQSALVLPLPPDPRDGLPKLLLTQLCALKFSATHVPADFLLVFRWQALVCGLTATLMSASMAVGLTLMKSSSATE